MAHKALLMLRDCAAQFGISVSRLGGVPSWEYTFQQLKKFGLQPRTVFDIGVARGTPWLYSAFPNAFFILLIQRENLSIL